MSAFIVRVLLGAKGDASLFVEKCFPQVVSPLGLSKETYFVFVLRPSSGRTDAGLITQTKE
ncbi:MAG TPA: hypothetical protein VNN20_04515 [Thermodesulfobacteriota bacterium]|nr:hypothetical protein [Thermodesulfobacteriota bacterium]